MSKRELNGLSVAPNAKRMRGYRKRRRKGTRCVRSELLVTQIDALVRTGYLEQEDRDDAGALQMAMDTFISDAFFEAG
jgi:hypothetical protein